MSKISTLAVLLFLFLVTDSMAQRHSVTRRSIKPAAIVQHIPDVIIEEPVLTERVPSSLEKNEGKKWVMPECTETKSINNADKCEAYPWLSADGLRLYFTSNRDGGHGNIYYTDRTSVDLPFGNSKKVFPALANKYYAVSLTLDELTMILTLEGYTLYISERKSTKQNFGTPRLITELKDRELFGPGISPDGTELIAIDYGTRKGSNFSGSYSKTTVRFIKNAVGVFIEKDKLVTPENASAGPGQFGKDGLTYYCSLEYKNDNWEKLHCFTRTTKDADFVYGYELPAGVNVNKNNLQPSVNADGSIIAYCINNLNAWDNDDIRVVQLNKLPEEGRELKAPAFTTAIPKEMSAVTLPRPITLLTASSLPVLASLDNNMATATIVDKNKTASTVNIYPNPFTDHITIALTTTVAENVVLELFDATGKQVLSNKIITKTAQVTQVKTGDLPAGLYYYRITNGKLLLNSGTLVCGK